MLEKSTDFNVVSRASEGLQTLAPRLEPAQAKLAGDALIRVLEKSTDFRVVSGASHGLQTLAPRLEPAQAKRAGDAMIAFAEKSINVKDQDNSAAWEGLFAIAPRLEPASRDNLSTTATTAVLDYCSSIPHAVDAIDPSEAAKSIVVARSISSPRSLAKLLSHPACVAEQRDVLLERFEELVFYDGKLAFPTPDGAYEKKPSGDPPPPRRFHNLHDAAAWIQKNWPDFDLEPNCPVTWRGLR